MSTCVLTHRHRADPCDCGSDDRACATPRRALDGLYVCGGCFDRLEQTLAELPARYDDLAERLASGGGAGPKVTGSPERALPIVPAVADHREQIARVLASWASLVAEERGLRGPASPTPHTLAAWLGEHLTWCCAQPWIDDFTGEVRDLSGRAYALLYPSGRRRVKVGPCVECSGTLTATIAPVDDLLPSSIDCDADEAHSWSADRWLALGRRLHPGLAS